MSEPRRICNMHTTYAEFRDYIEELPFVVCLFLVRREHFESIINVDLPEDVRWQPYTEVIYCGGVKHFKLGLKFLCVPKHVSDFNVRMSIALTGVG
jgi:hypothetical protein